jgi:A/G-specific adenine glycosylase
MIKKTFFVNWFRKYGRSFPWRENEVSPFVILITEILLTQTKASDVIKIWHNLIKDYSTPKSIINASDDELFNKVNVLGFGNIKVKALKLASAYIYEQYNEKVPGDLVSLLKIPYVGEYAARAVLCFAFNKKVEIVDTNVLRLFSRYFGLQFNRDARRAPKSWEIAREILPREKRMAKPHNYGLLDFTADICKPGEPRCEICPLSQSCEYGQAKLDGFLHS